MGSSQDDEMWISGMEAVEALSLQDGPETLGDLDNEV